MANSLPSLCLPFVLAHPFWRPALVWLACLTHVIVILRPSSITPQLLLQLVGQLLPVIVNRVRDLLIQLWVVRVVDSEVDSEGDSNCHNYGNHYDQDQDVPRTTATTGGERERNRLISNFIISSTKFRGK